MPLYSDWSAPAMVTLVAAPKPWLTAVVSVTVATLLALPAVRTIEETVRVGMPVAVIVPVAGVPGMRVVVLKVVVVVEVAVTLKHTNLSLVLAAVAVQAVPTPVIVLTPSSTVVFPVFERVIPEILPLLPLPAVVKVAVQLVGRVASCTLTCLVPAPETRVIALIVTELFAPVLLMQVIAAVGVGDAGRVIVSGGSSAVVVPAAVWLVPKFPTGGVNLKVLASTKAML